MHHGTVDAKMCRQLTKVNPLEGWPRKGEASFREKHPYPEVVSRSVKVSKQFFIIKWKQ